jgi:acetylglutamate kinase
MEHYEEKTITEKRLVKKTCDICGAEIPLKWDAGRNIDDVEIKRKVGYRLDYGEGGEAKIFEPDICGKCFDEKILPFLKSLGIDEEKSSFAIDW